MRKRLSVCLVSCAMLSSFSAAAQDQCFNGPVALPALGGPPEWFDTNGDGFWRPELHDPRWGGSPQQPMKFGEINEQTVPPTPLPSAEDATFRALVAGGKLYVAIQVQVDSSGPNNQDAVYFGFTQGTAGNKAWAVRLIPDLSGATQPAAPTPPVGVTAPQDSPLPYQLKASSFRVYQTDDRTLAAPVWNAGSVIPGWFQNPAIFDRPALGNPRWAVVFAIDLNDAAIAAAGDLQVWWGAATYEGNVGGVDVIKLFGNTSPKTQSNASEGIPGTPIPKLVGQWETLASPGSACSGVTLSASDVGVWTGSPGAASPGSLTTTLCAAASCGNVENTFRVTARNIPNGAGIGNWDVRPRIRIADWGSTSAYWKWGPWKDVAATPTGTAIFTSPAASFTNANGWYIQAPVPDGGNPSVSSVTMDYQCDKGANPYCPMLTSSTATSRHQCVLVELGQKQNINKFGTSAVYRNMDYQGLSESNRDAKISLEGIKKATGLEGEIDVILKVETMNLPAHGTKPQWLPTKDMALARSHAEEPRTLPTKHVLTPKQEESLKKLRRAAVRPNPARGEALAVIERKTKGEIEKLNRVATSNRLVAGKVKESHLLSMNKEQILDAVYPSYRVRPYYGVKKKFSHGEKAFEVYEPMVPFGLRLEHDGALYGFTHALEAAAGVALQDLGGGWYRVKMKEETPIGLKTHVSAEEGPKAVGSEGPPKPTGSSSTPVTDPAPNPVPGEVPPSGRCNCRVAGDPGMSRSPWEMFLGVGVFATLFARRRLRHP